MSYTTQAAIQALVPPAHLRDALDDEASGMDNPTQLAQVITNADNDVDAYLAGIFTVPIDPVPAVCASASLIFACETIYARRIDSLGLSDRNPFKARADFWRSRLQKIGNGELPLDNATEKEVVPGFAILEDMTVDTSLK